MPSIFISRKTSDKHLAKRFKEIVEQEFPNLKVAYAEEMAQGLEPTSEIIRQVRECNWFILFWTDRFEDWTWPIFEAGMHFGKNSTKHQGKTHFYVFHHPDDIPNPPLNFWTRVPVNDDGLQKFWGSLYLNALRKRVPVSFDHVLREKPGLAILDEQIRSRYSEVWLAKKRYARDIVIRFNINDFRSRNSLVFPDSTLIKLEGDEYWKPLIVSDEYLPIREFESAYNYLRIVKSWQHCVCEGVRDLLDTGRDLTLGLPLLRLQKQSIESDDAILLRGSIRRICQTTNEYRVRICFSETPVYLRMPQTELVAQLIRLLEAIWQMRSTCLPIIERVYKFPSEENRVSDERMIRLLHSSIHNARAELAARGYDRSLLQKELSQDQFNFLSDIALTIRELFENWDNVTAELELIRFGHTDLNSVVNIEEKNSQLIRLTNSLSERVSDALHLVISKENAQSEQTPSRNLFHSVWNWLTQKDVDTP